MFSFLQATEEAKRKKLLIKVANTADNPFKDYLQTPLPNVNSVLSNLEFLSLDFETTGLDVNKDVILSMGYTLIRKNKIILAESKHQLIQINRAIPKETVVIHKITDDRAQTGMPVHNALEALFKAVAGRVVLVHYSKIEKNFLNAVCQRLYGHCLPMLLVDTMAIAHKHLTRTHGHFNPQQLRLFNLRQHYHLPRYNAHNALEDALATAELFLVQMARKGDMDKIILKTILSK